MKKSKKDQLGQRLRTISADLKLYFEKRMELVMLNAGEYVSGWMAASVQRAAGALFLLGGLCFLSVALAIYLGNLLGSESLGYVLVSLPLLVAGGLFSYLKPRSVFEKLQHSFENEVIKAIEQDVSAEKKKIESATMTRSTNGEE
ncbi:MAG: hypothetical protein U5J63_10235 [Fodinibius sp.]|nr:hypothetical protein [Fodinibius sp.]